MAVNIFTTIMGLVKRTSYSSYELLAFLVFVTQLTLRDIVYTVCSSRRLAGGAWALMSL